MYWVIACALSVAAVGVQETRCPNQQDHTVVLLQTKTKKTSACPKSPQIGGSDLSTLISSTQGILLVAIEHMKCTEAVKLALNSHGASFENKNFTGPFKYTAGASDVWDYLHCKYPKDTSNGMIMHSYVFSSGEFVGNGFVAADKINSGGFDHVLGNKTCEERFPVEANIVKHYMANGSNKVLLFGWLSCECVGIAKQRLQEKKVCYDGRQWEDPTSKLMTYFQCKEKDMSSHSFVYFRKGSGWSFAGNGFKLASDKMSETELDSLIQESGAMTNCKHANVKVNVFGTQLEECRVGNDMSGSWMDDGTCSEQMGGIHQICIEALPADFSSETHQSPWSKERKDKRHCVCIGAWSLYMTDAAKHAEGAKGIMPHCKAIPETTLTSEYLKHWRDWNGYPAEVLTGVKELVSRCLGQVSNETLKCGLKQRFEKLRSNPEANLTNATELEDLAKRFSGISCAESELAQTAQIPSSPCQK